MALMISLRCPIGRDADGGIGAGTGSVLSMKLGDLSTTKDKLAKAAKKPTADGSNVDFGCAKLTRIPYP
jgi:hypothetical protein